MNKVTVAGFIFSVFANSRTVFRDIQSPLVESMFNWHDPTCRRPDVVFADGIPSCLYCGNIGVYEETSSQSQGVTLEEPSSVKFDLCWPSSLPFIDDDLQASQLDNSAPVPTGETSLPVCESKPIVQVQNSGRVKAAFYETLQARKIRILELLPGDFDEPLRGNLRIEDLQFKPEFEALSYTWTDESGDASKSEIIFLESRHDILPITTNCANALRRLRFTKISNLSRDLWVDAICINQESVQERSHQVGIMQYIYATALRVLVYLGEDSGDPNPGTSAPWIYQNNGNTLDLDSDLSKRPYFSRTWVIQEIASARSAWVLYGSRGARWQDFLGPVQKNRPHPWLSLVAQPRHREMSELYNLLVAASNCKASDPRDKVFALLNLFIGANDAGFAADYSLSHAQVFAGTTAFLLLQNPQDWANMFAMIDSSRSSKLPSWAVDWASPLCQHDSKQSHSVTPHLFKSGDCNARFLRNGELVLRGYHLLRLGECKIVRTAATARPSGIVGSVEYMPAYSSLQREAFYEDSTWANMNDELFIVAGLDDHALLLRPKKGTNKHTFVAVCELPFFDREANMAHTLGRRVILLVSTWNEIFGMGSHAWSSAEIWHHIKEVCCLIRHFWHLEQKAIGESIWNNSQEKLNREQSKGQPKRSIADTSKALESDNGYMKDLRTALRSKLAILEGALERASPNAYELLRTPGERDWRLPEVRFTRNGQQNAIHTDDMEEELIIILLQAVREHVVTDTFDGQSPSRSFLRRKHARHRLSISNPIDSDLSLSQFFTLLSERFGVTFPPKMDLGSAWFTDKLLNQRLASKTRALDKVLLLPWSNERTEADIRSMPWSLRNSLNFQPEKFFISDGGPRNSSCTWASSFLELWASWKSPAETIEERESTSPAPEDTSDQGPACPAVPSSTELSKIPANESYGDGMQTDTEHAMGDDDAGDSRRNDPEADDKAFLKQSADRTTWRILLELVRETEQQLLPLEGLFTADDHYHFTRTHWDKRRFKSRREPKWEDVHIV